MKDKIFKWIDDAVELAVDLETGLTKIPAVSPESGGEGELDKFEYLERWLRSHGITNIERFDAPDSRAKGAVRPNLIATIEGLKDNARLWVLSHMDVVPPGEESLWESDPWTVIRKDDEKGERLIGRGVEDNQQGVVSSTLASLAFVRQGLKPVRTVKLLFASDEEVGSKYGIEWLVKNHKDLFHKDDMVLVPDGGDIKGECIEIAEKNIIWARFAVHGKQAHGAQPDLGVNAMIAGSDLAVCLYNGLSSKFNKKDPMFDPDYSTFQPTKREANVKNVNTIPGEDIFCMDMRILPCYKSSDVLAEIENIMRGIEKKYNVKIEYTLSQFMESKPTEASSVIVKRLEKAVSEIYNIKTKTIGIGGGTMAASLRNIGIDCAVWTKTDETMHQPNEYVLLKNIIGDAKVIALLMINGE